MRQENFSAGKNIVQIDLSKQPPGAYNLLAEFDTGIRMTKQLIKLSVYNL